MFRTRLQVMMETGSGNRTLTAPLQYFDKVWKLVEAPIGFVTNFASIPNIVPRWWLDQDDPLIREPSVIHDWVYGVDCPIDLSRLEADELLLRAMLDIVTALYLNLDQSWFRHAINKAKAYSAYYSVRVAGASHWKKI